MEKLKFYDIYEFYYVSFWKSKLFLSLIYVIFFCLLGLFIYWLIKYLINKNKKPLSIWQRVERELLQIDPTNLSSRDEFKNFYFNLSIILKNYLGMRYKLNLEDKTDDEVEPYLKNKLFNVRLTASLVKILQGSKFVKFAGEKALPSKAKEDWNQAFVIIQNTVPKE